MELGQHYQVEVIEIVNVGCVVKMEDNSTQLIHLSKISNEFVKNISDFVAVGQTLDAECVQGFKKLELSLKHLNLKSKNSTPQTLHNNRPKKSDRSSHFEEMYNKDEDYDRPKFQSKPRKHKTTPSLDEMISASNQVCEDKMRRMNKRNKDKQYKNRKYR